MATDTLSNMVRDLRSEAGHSLSITQGANTVDTLKYILKRTQLELWTAFVWPDLRLRQPLPLVASQWSYPFPVQMAFDQIREVWYALSTGADWIPVTYGISESMIMPDDSNTQAGLPTQYWDTDAGGMIRVWPTPPVGNASLRLIGNKPLGPFVNDTDQSTLDSTLIVMFAGAELLARAKAEDASLKMQKAQRHLLKILGSKVSSKNKVSTLGARPGSASRPTPYLDFIPQTR
jgi:hypothetical protein